MAHSHSVMQAGVQQHISHHIPLICSCRSVASPFQLPTALLSSSQHHCFISFPSHQVSHIIRVIRQWPHCSPNRFRLLFIHTGASVAHIITRSSCPPNHHIHISSRLHHTACTFSGSQPASPPPIAGAASVLCSNPPSCIIGHCSPSCSHWVCTISQQHHITLHLPAWSPIRHHVKSHQQHSSPIIR